MKKNLLKIVQEILNDMSSDEVTSIDDTVEAQQVASIVESTFYEMLANRNWPHTLKLMQIDSSGDITRPTHMRLPERLKELKTLNYDIRDSDETVPEYRAITYMHPDEFLKHVNRFSSDTLVVEDFGGGLFPVKTTQHPTYWTSFDDDYVVFDSYDATVNNTLQKSRTQVLAYIIPVFGKANTAVPDLPAEAFPALIEESKSVAFLNLKQMANQKAEQKAMRQQRWLSRKAWRAKGGVRTENYGR